MENKRVFAPGSSEDALGSAERALEPAMIWELKSAKELTTHCLVEFYRSLWSI